MCEGRVTTTKMKLADEQHELAKAQKEYTQVRGERQAANTLVLHGITLSRYVCIVVYFVIKVSCMRSDSAQVGTATDIPGASDY